jgi:hypothetical protein
MVVLFGYEMACLPTVEFQFDLRVVQQANRVLDGFVQNLIGESRVEQRHSMSKAYPYTHRALSPNQQTRRGHLPLMNLRTLQAKAEGGL